MWEGERVKTGRVDNLVWLQSGVLLVWTYVCFSPFCRLLRFLLSNHSLQGLPCSRMHTHEGGGINPNASISVSLCTLSSPKQNRSSADLREVLQARNDELATEVGALRSVSTGTLIPTPEMASCIVSGQGMPTSHKCMHAPSPHLFPRPPSHSQPALPTPAPIPP